MYSWAANARRSPSPRLYSGVPRSSQCPSMVTTQVGYRMSRSAFASAVLRPRSSSSELSSPKNTASSGDSRFNSSSVRLANSSSGVSTGGTTGGGAGGGGTGRGAGARSSAAGGGGGDVSGATGGGRRAHDCSVSVATTQAAIAAHKSVPRTCIPSPFPDSRPIRRRLSCPIATNSASRCSRSPSGDAGSFRRGRPCKSASVHYRGST